MRLDRVIAALALAAAATSAHAQIGLAASATPPVVTFVAGSNPVLRITWTVAADPLRGTPVAAHSVQGTLTDRSGAVIAVIPGVLTVVGSGRVSETVRLDQFVDPLTAAAGGFVYQRDWTDDAGRNASAQARIAMVGSQAGALQIREVRVRFADGNDQTKVVDENETPAAYAEISFTGRGGVIDYEWLLADPASTRATPVFVRIGQSRTALRGASPARIAAPRLPTTRSGPYRLRFHLREPAFDLDALVSYYVRPAPSFGATIRLLGPPDDAALAAQAPFRWSPLEGATLYQLELYGERGDERLTGVQLPAAPHEMATPLTDVARLHVAQGCRCRWRVLAFDAQGDLRGASAMRRVLIAPEAPAP